MNTSSADASKDVEAILPHAPSHATRLSSCWWTASRTQRKKGRRGRVSMRVVARKVAPLSARRFLRRFSDLILGSSRMAVFFEGRSCLGFREEIATLNGALVPETHSALTPPDQCQVGSARAAAHAMSEVAQDLFHQECHSVSRLCRCCACVKSVEHGQDLYCLVTRIG